MARVLIDEKTIADYMKRNKCSREEAIELINYDNDIENGLDTEYDLTPEQEKNVKALNRQIEHKSSKPRIPRKSDEQKTAIVQELAHFLENDAMGQDYENVSITNPTRMIRFTINNEAFELTLIKTRAKK